MQVRIDRYKPIIQETILENTRGIPSFQPLRGDIPERADACGGVPV